MDSGLRDARLGTILVVASRHCEARSSPIRYLTDKSTIILLYVGIIVSLHRRNYCLINSFKEYAMKAKPFIKWVGGKGQLIEQLEAMLPADFDNWENVTDTINV